MVFSLVAACDDARIRVWDIPEGGLTETLTEPEFFLIGKFHLSHMRKEAQLITYTHSHTHTYTHTHTHTHTTQVTRRSQTFWHSTPRPVP